ncbi:MAG: EAL domain-containing protein [Rhodospirillales bacterium]|nr:EAL domain-containing protein [Rhodospirillales bacterium]
MASNTGTSLGAQDVVNLLDHDVSSNDDKKQLPDETKALLAEISHELRTPLNTIIGFAQMMEEELLGPIGSPQYREYAAMIGKSGKGILDHFDEQVSRERLSGLRSSEDYEYIIELAPDMICICRGGIISKMNAAGVAMLGMWDADTVVGRPIVDFVHNDYKELMLNDMEALVEERQVVPIKLTLGDNRNIDIEVSALTLQVDDEATESAVIFTARDVTERHRSLIKTIDREEQLRKTMDTVADGIVVIDSSGNIELINMAGEAIFGYLPGEMISADFGPMLGRSPENSNADVAEHILSMDGGETTGTMREFEGVRKDNSIFPLEITISQMIVGGRRLYIGSFRDISDRKEKERELRRLATRDPLTGLPNRYLFEQSLDEAIETTNSNGGRFAILNIDLNSFKNINEALGHVFGDKIIKAVGERLEECLGGAGMVSHLGSDDFLVIVTGNPDTYTLETMASYICSELSKPLHVDEKEIFTSCTIGICIYPDNALDRVEIMQHADTAMHHGKATDIGGFVFYEEHLSAQVYRNLDIDRNLRRAIERKEFKLLYQPKIDLQSRKIIGCEALIRWESAELGFVPPDEFIIVAERSSLIIDIGNWVLDEACRQGKEWMDKGLPAVHVAVNLSAVQFLQGDIDELITGAVAKHGFDPERLDLELTETMLVVNPEQTINTLKRMKERGMSVSMDDFGTGYSSLSFMAKLPLDNLKVDRSFVMHLPEDRDAATLVRTIVTMAQQLGLAVIAEGIETASQEAFLSALGCEMGQGYLFGKPMEPSDFEDLVRNGL